MEAISTTRYEIAAITAEMRIRKALASSVTRNADLKLEVDDLVRIFRETDKRYIGPFPEILVYGKQVLSNKKTSSCSAEYIKYSLQQSMKTLSQARSLGSNYIVPLQV